MTDQQALCEYVVSRNAEAFRILVEQYQRLVYSAASRRLAHAQDIEDVVQITFLKLAKAAGAIHRDLAAWLYATAINTANDLIRRDHTRRRHEASAAQAESFINDPMQADWDKLSLLIDEVVLELPEAQQLLVVEYFLRGRSQRDLAQELDISQPTVLRRINAAVDELRQRLANRGYSVAAPLLASTLGQIPQPPVPASVTAELVKVGLSGISTGSGGTFPLFSGSLLIKFSLGVMILGMLLVGAIFLLPSAAAPKLAIPAPTTQSGIPATNPPDWHATFNKAYALEPGRNLKFIPPPPLPERQRYMHEIEKDDTPMPFIQWRWINGTLKRQWMAGRGPAGAPLSMVLMACANLDGHHISIEGIPAINADGDWIVRDGASTEAILTDLHAILLDHFKIDVRFEKNEVTKDALIATGQYHLRRILGATSGDLQIFSDVLDHPKPGDRAAGGGTADSAEFWSTVGGILGIPIVDETQNEPKEIDWFLSFSIANADKDSARRQQILDNITKQTGLAFKQEKRTFTTWKFTVAPNQDTTTRSSN